METFICENCRKNVSNAAIGTHHRNHCPFCLWSLHVDKDKPGDRDDPCQGLMEPIGLTFKKEGIDKYGKLRQGELMVVHRCLGCGKISINRIAADDEAKEILKVFEKSLKRTENVIGIEFLGEKDREEIETQLFGKRV